MGCGIVDKLFLVAFNISWCFLHGAVYSIVSTKTKLFWKIWLRREQDSIFGSYHLWCEPARIEIKMSDVCLFVLFLRGFFCVALAVLELTLALNSQRSTCFCFPSAGIKIVSQYCPSKWVMLWKTKIFLQKSVLSAMLWKRKAHIRLDQNPHGLPGRQTVQAAGFFYTDASKSKCITLGADTLMESGESQKVHTWNKSDLCWN